MSTHASRAVLTVGALAAMCGIALIWLARVSIPRPVYVSELGAAGMSTARMFAVALLLIAAGGALIAVLGRHPRTRFRLICGWPVAMTLAFSSVFFVVASQVSCSAGCPVPIVDAGSKPQDLVHTVAAVLGFAAGCVAMLQVALGGRSSRITRISAAACLFVAAITIAGGMLSVVQFATWLGGVLEFVGATVAVLWLAVYGLWLAWRPDRATVSQRELDHTLSATRREQSDQLVG